jgi:hypothetical protein
MSAATPTLVLSRSGAVSRPQSAAGIDLYWLPLGAGGHSVRLNGRVFEAVVSRLEHRPACDLYHSALDAGEMWSSNSVTSWLIARTGLAAESIQPPDAGRAPGWEAEIVVAPRQEAQLHPALAPSRVTGNCWTSSKEKPA